jgi:hypothetical protein
MKLLILDVCMKLRAVGGDDLVVDDGSQAKLLCRSSSLIECGLHSCAARRSGRRQQLRRPGVRHGDGRRCIAARH